MFDGGIGSRSDDDRRQPQALFPKLRNEFKTVHARHLIVHDHAINVRAVPEEVAAALVGQDIDAVDLQEQPRGNANRYVIVDDRDRLAMQIGALSIGQS